MTLISFIQQFNKQVVNSHLHFINNMDNNKAWNCDHFGCICSVNLMCATYIAKYIWEHVCECKQLWRCDPFSFLYKACADLLHSMSMCLLSAHRIRSAVLSHNQLNFIFILKQILGWLILALWQVAINSGQYLIYKCNDGNKIALHESREKSKQMSAKLLTYL